jgi:hypothetical protein
MERSMEVMRIVDVDDHGVMVVVVWVEKEVWN